MSDQDQMVRRLLERWDVSDIRVVKLGKLPPAPPSIDVAPPARDNSYERAERHGGETTGGRNAPKVPKPPPSPFFAEVRWIKHSIDEQAYVALLERGATSSEPH